MIDIPFYTVLPFHLTVVELLATLLMLGAIFSLFLWPTDVRWYQFLRLTRKTMVISAIITFLFPTIGFAFVGYYKSTRIESAYTQISEYKEVADRIGMPLKPDMQQYLDTANAVASQEIPWYRSFSALHKDPMQSVENHYADDVHEKEALRWSPLSESEHKELNHYIEACVDWEKATDDFKATVGSYPVLKMALPSMLEMIYKKQSVEWMDRGCFARFAVPWAANN